MDRIITVSDNELNDSEAAHCAYLSLLPVMLYPEDVKKQNDWRDAVACDQLPYIINNGGDPLDGHFLAAYGEKAIELAFKSTYLKGVLKDSLESRKAGLLGAPLTRGAIAGQILWHLVKPSYGTLESAYKEVVDRFQCNLSETSPLAIPSKSSLKQIWGEYKNVSHFWAAEHCFRENGWSEYLCSGPSYNSIIHPEAARYFVYFLGIASFFREKLLNLQNPSTQTALIPTKAFCKVWKVIRGDGSLVPPMELILP